MPSGFERLRAALTDASSLRSWTVDANDGIIATAGVLEGFAGAGASEATLFTAAMLATIAGGLSLGGAKWFEESAERDSQLKLASDEAAELERSPEAELDELAEYYVGRGVTPEVARVVAEQLTAHDALAAQLETEHSIREIMPRSAPILAGVSASLAFTLGALIPLLITALVPVAIESWAILFAVVVSLIGTSIISARSGDIGVWRTVARTLTFGVWVVGVSYLLGLLLF